MRWRGLLWRWRFVVAALALGTAAAVVVDALSPAPPATVAVVVAAHRVDAGSTLGPGDLALLWLPADAVPSGWPRRTRDVTGSTTTVAVDAGTPLVAGVLSAGGPRGPDGSVVAPVRLADPAVVDVLVPGAHVDVLAATADGGPATTVAQRALVLPGAPSDAGEGGLLGSAGGDDRPLLLAVAPDEAAALAGASAAALLSAVVVP